MDFLWVMEIYELLLFDTVDNSFNPQSTRQIEKQPKCFGCRHRKTFERNMWGNGEMDSFMEEANASTEMEIFMMDNGSTINGMAVVNYSTKSENLCTKEGLEKILIMA